MKLKGHITARAAASDRDHNYGWFAYTGGVEYRLCYGSFDEEDTDGWVLVKDFEVEVDASASREELIPTMVAGLRQQMEDTRVRSELKCREIDEQINNLLALPADIVGTPDP